MVEHRIAFAHKVFLRDPTRTRIEDDEAAWFREAGDDDLSGIAGAGNADAPDDLAVARQARDSRVGDLRDENVAVRQRCRTVRRGEEARRVALADTFFVPLAVYGRRFGIDELHSEVADVGHQMPFVGVIEIAGLAALLQVPRTCPHDQVCPTHCRRLNVELPHYPGIQE